jgi:hypothetical protein
VSAPAQLCDVVRFLLGLQRLEYVPITCIRLCHRSSLFLISEHNIIFATALGSFSREHRKTHYLIVLVSDMGFKIFISQSGAIHHRR